ncbi:secreted lipase like protein [Verticillium longisporum]
MRASSFLVSALAAAGLASASCKPSNCEATNRVAFGCSTVDKAYVRDAFFLGGRTVALLLTNDCPERVAASINLEPFTVPFFFYGWGLGGFPARPYGLTNSPLDYVPPVASAAELKIESVGNETLAKRNCYRQVEPARQLPKVASVPYVALTGQASVHITYDHCIIDYLKQVGGKPEWIKLDDLGIKGNGHFLHQERNSEEIADVVLRWINKADGKGKATRAGL